MRNLAGVHYADDVINEELSQAGVPIIEVPRDEVHSEVPYTLEGQMRGFKFRRAWRYWVVEGRVPIEAARELYENPVGRKAVRAGGDCTCPEPETQAEWLGFDGERLYPDPTGEQEARWRQFIETHPACRNEPGTFVPDPSVVPGAHAFVTCYHIDTQEGLNLFVETMRKWCTGPRPQRVRTVYDRLLEAEDF